MLGNLLATWALPNLNHAKTGGPQWTILILFQKTFRLYYLRTAYMAHSRTHLWPNLVAPFRGHQCVKATLNGTYLMITLGLNTCQSTMRWQTLKNLLQLLYVHGIHS